MFVKQAVQPGHSIAVCEPLDVLAEKMLEIVQEACCASDVVLQVREDTLGADRVYATRRADNAAQLHRLKLFLQSSDHRKRCLQHDVGQLEGNCVFLKLPLVALDQRVGMIALAISVDHWSHADVFSTCTQIANLVALNMASHRSRLQLEIDLAELTRRSATLARAAEIDALTQIENKGSFERKARRRLARSSRPAALIAVDLDEFKMVNDVYGHQFGDRFLQTISGALKACLPKTALLGRTGGDEFCVLLEMPDAGKAYLDGVIQHVRLGVQRGVALLGKPDLGRMSIGVSLFPRQAKTFETLYANADQALYASKRAERNTTTFFSSRHCGIVEPLRRKNGRLEASKIVPFAQPLFDVKTGARTGVEILARWRDEVHGLCGPSRFEWLFKDHRFASDLTIHIVREALQEIMAAVGGDKASIPDLWINVTSHDLRSSEFVFDLQACLSNFGVGWDKVVIEVSEEAMLGATNGGLFWSLTEIRRRGGRVALDDFGTGYAGLMHIPNWPVDILKIDRSFIEKSDDSEGAAVVIEALVMIGSTMQQTIVAEGIETQEQFERIHALGCDLAQGYLLGTPQPCKDFPKVARFDAIPGLDQGSTRLRCAEMTG